MEKKTVKNCFDRGKELEGLTWFAPIRVKGKIRGTLTGKTLDEVLEKQQKTGLV